MKLMDLIEARKNPDQNIKLSTMQQFDVVMKNHDTKNLYVTFSDIPKLGANPQSSFRTPLGIYAYPINYVKSKGIIQVPFAGNRHYIIIFKCDSNKLWNLQIESPKIKSSIVDTLDSLNIQIDIPNLEKQPTNILWKAIYRALKFESNIGILVRKILSKSGIIGVLDNGTGTIHEKEPIQAVFFDISELELVTILDNKRTTELFQSNINSATQLSLTHFKQILKLGRKQPPKVEQQILKNSDYATQYSIKILKRRWLEAEPIILTSPSNTILYANELIKGRWLEAEPILKIHPKYAYLYIINKLHSRWPEAEPYLEKENSKYFELYKQYVYNL